MHFVLQTPSLQHLAGVKIVTCLWTQPDVFPQIPQTYNGHLRLRNDRTQWKEMKEKVKSKVAALSIPELCKKALLNFIEPLGMQIDVWYHYHNKYEFQSIDLDTLLHNHLRWSMHGTVEYAKTAQLMVKDESLDVERRYEIACLNCLEDEARELFERIDEEQRQAYINGTRNIADSLIIYFTCILSGNVRHLHSYLQQTTSSPSGESCDTNLLKTMVLRDGITQAAREYFFEKLTQREKEQVLLAWFEYDMSMVEPITNNVLFYLPLLNEEQRQDMFTEFIGAILSLLLDWPMQSLFMDVASRWWHYMDEEDGASVLYDIFERINQLDCHACDYWHLFWEFWRLISAEYHREFFYVFHLDVLIRAKRKEFIQLFFKQVSWRSLKHLVEKRYEEMSHALMDESVISDAALMECKQTALLSNSNAMEDEEKRLRSQHLNRLVDFAIESRIKRRKM